MDRRKWTGWYTLCPRGKRDRPLGLSACYELEVAPGPQEFERAGAELERFWLADGGTMEAVVPLLDGELENFATVQCEFRGRVLDWDELQVLSRGN